MTSSVETCYQYLEDYYHYLDDSKNKEKPNSTPMEKQIIKDLKKNPILETFMREIETRQTLPSGLGVHPKIEKLKEILGQHFGISLANEPGKRNREVDCSKCIVFASHRGSVREIVQALERERPLIRAAKFIGQSTDTHGNKGLQEQLEVSTGIVSALGLFPDLPQ